MQQQNQAVYHIEGPEMLPMSVNLHGFGAIFTPSPTHQRKTGTFFRIVDEMPDRDSKHATARGGKWRFNAHPTFRRTPILKICPFLIKIHLRPTPQKTTNIPNHQQYPQKQQKLRIFKNPVQKYHPPPSGTPPQKRKNRPIFTCRPKSHRGLKQKKGQKSAHKKM